MYFESFKNKFQKEPVKEVPNEIIDSPIVSVCVQTYQHFNYIKQCLDGILMQKTNFPFEILLGEDESTDGTREICLEYANKYPDRIRLLLHHRENNISIGGNPTGRFNFSYNLYTARGKYIALCEGDDYWTDPLKLQKQVDFLERNSKVNLCFHRANLLQENSLKIHPVPGKFQGTSFNFIELLRYYNFIATSSIMFRMPPQLNIPLWFTEVTFGDLGLYKLISLDKKIVCLNEEMAVYRIHKKGIWSGLDILESKIAYLTFYENIYVALNKKEKKIVEIKIHELYKEIAKLKFQGSRIKQKGYYYFLKINYTRKKYGN